jgi:hypothetical protein
MNHKLKKGIISLSMLILLPYLSLTKVFAEDEPFTQQNGIGFDVYTFPNEHQVSKNNSIYHLNLKPGQETTIAFSVHNNTDEPSDFEISVNTATTNSNVIIDYSKGNEKGKFTKNLPFMFEDIVKVKDKKITVDAQSSEKIELPLKMPEKSYPGMALGGLYIKRKNSNEKGVNPQFSYVKPIIITEKDEPVERKISYKKTELASKNWTVFLSPIFENPFAVTLEGVTFEMKIKDSKNKQILKKVLPKGQVAPNTIFPLLIKCPSKKVPAGKYTISGSAKDNKGRLWKFHDKFTITKKQSRQAEENASWETGKNYSVIIGFIACVLVIVLLLILLFKQRVSKK